MNLDDHLKSELQALKQQLEYHAHRYYVLDAPEISDAQYDALFQRLLLIESEFPELESTSSS